MHIVSGELRKAPYIKSGCGPDQQSTLFIVELSEVTKDRQTGEKSYANYSAAIFAKSPAQINYYTSTLVEGNFIVVNCEKLRVDVQESNGKQYIKLQMENARLEGAQYIKDAPQQQQQQRAPQQVQNMQQLAPQQAPQQVQQAPVMMAPMSPQQAQQMQQQPPQGQPMGVSQQQPQQQAHNYNPEPPF